MTQGFNWTLLALVCLMLFSDGEGWRRRRRRRPCSVTNCSVSGWTTFSRCTLPCGTDGVKTRTRTVTKGATCGGTCPYPLKETVKCNSGCSNHGREYSRGCYCDTGYSGLCCTGVDGGWSSWSSWQSCSKTCGTGRRDRTRSCTRPSPRNGGNTCRGEWRDEGSCYTQPCPVDGGWSSWSSWQSCSKTCGTGRRDRTRSCTSPAPRNGGNTCRGEWRDEISCYTQPCPVDGAWSAWTHWTTCTKTCGTGSQERSRSCTQPAPKHNGNSCTGPAVTKEICNKNSCPVHGRWSEWGKWSPCNLTCGTGKISRERLCNNPAPQGDGNPCVGDSTKYKPCSTPEICLAEIGCYRKDPSLFPDLLGDFQSEIKWFSKPFAKEMQRIVQKCANVATKKGLRIFAIENFAFCYGDRLQDYNFSNKTVSKECSFGVGWPNSYFVYMAAA